MRPFLSTDKKAQMDIASNVGLRGLTKLNDPLRLINGYMSNQEHAQQVQDKGIFQLLHSDYLSQPKKKFDKFQTIQVHLDQNEQKQQTKRSTSHTKSPNKAIPDSLLPRLAGDQGSRPKNFETVNTNQTTRNKYREPGERDIWGPDAQKMNKLSRNAANTLSRLNLKKNEKKLKSKLNLDNVYGT